MLRLTLDFRFSQQRTSKNINKEHKKNSHSNGLHTKQIYKLLPQQNKSIKDKKPQRYVMGLPL